jgi:hypothetical protein
MKVALIVVTAAVLFLGGQYLLTWFASRRRVRVGRTGGVATLRLARGRNVVLGLLALLPAILFAVLTYSASERGTAGTGLALAIPVTLAAFAASAYFFAAEFRKRVRVDDAGLERIGVFTRRRLAWSDVTKIAYNPWSHWFFVVGKDGTRIWVYESFEGVADFAEAALQHVPPQVLAAGLYVREELEDLAAA